MMIEIPSRAKTMRRILLFLILVSAVSCAPGIYAKTDCDRWLAQYKQALLQKRAVQRANAARRRLQAKLVGTPKPVAPRPTGKRPVLKRRMSPLEALNHFQLACGDLEPANDGPNLQPVAFGVLPAFDLPEFPFIPAASSLVADNVPPPLPPIVDRPAGPTPSFPGPIFGTPPIQVTVPTTPTTPVTPVVPVVPVTPVVPEVPEPGSIVLVLTGAGAAIAAARRRFFARF